VLFALDATHKPALIRFGDEIAEILRRRPQTGPLFPYLRTVRPGDRATEFRQRCKGINISGVSLHSYRYAWAERASECGYPLRFAQEALGHNSKAKSSSRASPTGKHLAKHPTEEDSSETPRSSF